jgi:hypothetical protein
MKTLLKASLLLLLSSATLLHAGSITVGNADSGNCYPFMCNDSGTSSGVSIDYQQAFVSSAFPGTTTINTISWGFWPYQGSPIVLGGDYSFYWGYSAVGLGLGSYLPGNYSGAADFLGTAFVPAGGENFGSTLTLSGFAPFTYNPLDGDLLLEIVVSNQDNVCNGCGNGYNWADYTGATTTRDYSFLGSLYGTGAEVGALQTTFGTSTVTPEPGSLLLLGTGLMSLAGMLRRKRA